MFGSQTVLGFVYIIIFVTTFPFLVAAKNFLEVSFAMGSGYSDVSCCPILPFLKIPHFQVVSPNDVAVYGGLCALASLTRKELKTKVFENSEFRQFLELEPQVRTLLELFYASKYGACLSLLQKMRVRDLIKINRN
jgi:COP9 signalosome complex subunit 1